MAYFKSSLDQPGSLRLALFKYLSLIEAHTQAGHSAFKKILKYLKSRCYYEGMTDTIQQVLDAFPVYKSHTWSNLQFKQDVPTPNKPFHVVITDLIGPLPVAAGGHQYILIAVNYLNK